MEKTLLHCGLLGRSLGHSYSPRIHSLLGTYEYRLFEKEPNELEAFLSGGDWKGLNVTIPYKKDVLTYCSRLSDAAKAIGSVNTLVRMADGTLSGDNTDAYGFACLLEHNGIRPAGKKALILGNGGACAAVLYVLKKMGSRAVVISRTGKDNYDNLDRHADAQLIVNTTPLGMYPNNGAQAVDLEMFPQAEAVLDLIYNPARTAIMLQAEHRNIRTDNGLYMLVAQAYASSIRFTEHDGDVPDKAVIDSIYQTLSSEMQNIILVGMPGCGKSSVAQCLGRIMNREVLDLDESFRKTYSMTPEQCILDNGEDVFRRMESAVIAEAGKASGKIIATGGGCVTIPGNYPLMHQNGRIVWICRDLSLLPQEGRPLSVRNGVESLYQVRKPLYEAFADLIVSNDGTPEETAQEIAQAF